MNTLLGKYRVLDLCDEKGVLCGKILGDMGADVVKIEKPGGDKCRYIGPFYGDKADREKSLFWFAFNNNKRGITLDIETSEGKRLFRQLVKKSDVVLESFTPGYLDTLGLGYKALAKINPKIVLTSITPFGQTGPYADYKGTDMVVWALGGLMNLCGDADRPPVQVSLPQSYMAASTYAAEATTIALYERGNSGLGQHIDLSAQATIAWFTAELIPFWYFYKQDVKRAGQAHARAGGLMVPTIIPCKDGHVSYLIQAGHLGAERNRQMAAWLEEKGLATQYTREKDWKQLDWAKMTPAELEELVQPVIKLLAAHTKEELFAEATKRDILLYPVRTSQEIVDSVQLKARNFWSPLYHEALDASITYPGPFAYMSATPITLRSRAPLIGEHNEEIYTELGLTKEKLVSLRGKGVI